MHHLVRQPLDRLKAAAAADPAKPPTGFVAVAPRDLEALQRAARGEGLDGLRWPADGREVCIQLRSAEELIAAVEAAQAPPEPGPEGEVPGDD